MTLISDAIALYAGNQPAIAVYAGQQLAWTAETLEMSLGTAILPKPIFPIKVRPDGRGLRGSTGVPYSGILDTLWNGPSRMSLAEFTTYCQGRRAQGFTGFLTSILDINSRSRTQHTTGVTPFAGTGASANFKAPNQTYFNAVKAKLDVARAEGLWVGLIPGWYGYAGNMWRPNWGATPTDLSIAESYGAYLAAQFGGYDNVFWLHGGDNGPTTANNQAASSAIKIDLTAITNAHANAIKAGSAVDQLHSYHTNRGDHASAYFGNEEWYDMHAAYSGTNVPGETVVEYARGDKPVIFVEGYYINRDTVNGVPTPHPLQIDFRTTMWQAYTTGALAVANGNEYVWPVRDFYTGAVWDDPVRGMNDPTASDMTVMSKVLATFGNKDWIADASLPMVVANRGAGSTLAGGLKSLDATSGLVYIPTARTFEISLTAFPPRRAGLWVNPDTGATQSVQMLGATRTLTTPTGWADSALLISSEV